MAWNEDVGMAFRALVHAGMNVMTENYHAAIIVKGDIVGGVALGAIPFDRESSRPIVTGPTGSSFLFHRFHCCGKSRFGRIDVEECIVAGRTVFPYFFQMKIMTEINRPSCLAVYGYFVLQAARKGGRRNKDQ